MPILRESPVDFYMLLRPMNDCFRPLALLLALSSALLFTLPAQADPALDDPTPKAIDLTPRPAIPDDSGFPEKTLKTDSATFTGRFELDADRQITGSVRIDWKNGDRFEGHMLHGKRIGPGRFAFGDGQIHEGEWVDDRLQGKGHIRYANGDDYTGDLTASLPDGLGTLEETTGNRYEGGWRAGHKDGYGTYTWANGQIYEGHWSEDHATGQGSITQPNGNHYSGGVLNCHPEGQGSLSFAETGDRYVGHFHNGLPDGTGTFTWKNGDHYDGPWEMGKKSGFGRYTWADGDYWEGSFVADEKADGRMVFTPHIEVSGKEISDLLEQTRDELGGESPSDGTPEAPEALRQVPLVEAELKTCSTQHEQESCENGILEKIREDREFSHQWQLLTRATPDAHDHSRMEVDRHSTLSDGSVFTWLRFSATDSAHSEKAGIRYNCETQTIDIQLVYHCLGSQAMAVCRLDQNFTSYLGKSIPATPIAAWFDTACRRRYGGGDSQDSGQGAGQPTP